MIAEIAGRNSVSATKDGLRLLFQFSLPARILVGMFENKDNTLARYWYAFIDAYTHRLTLEQPPCRRRPFASNDLDALWSDFIRTRMDVIDAHAPILLERSAPELTGQNSNGEASQRLRSTSRAASGQ